MKRLLKIIFIVLLSGALIKMMYSCQRVNPPVVRTVSVSGITQTSAVSGGNVTDDGGAEIVEYGICWSNTKNPTLASNKTVDGAGAGSFTSIMTGLNVNTRYYVRAYAFNSEGISFGNEISFTTNPVIPASVSTSETSIINYSSVLTGGNVNSDGYGTITARGVCWSVSRNPTTSDSKTADGSGTGSFQSSLTGLSTNTTYYVRTYAINESGTSYGNEQSFTLWMNVSGPAVTDADGHIYSSVKIGSQVWMAENLRTTKYNNGIDIPMVPDNDAWNLYRELGAFCWYNNDEATYGTSYGALYNWSAVETGHLCPVGWHVPSSIEWNILIDYLGGESSAGGKLKEAGTEHWMSPNTGATNESGFKALPGGGRRTIVENFTDINRYGYWWTSTGTTSYKTRFKAMTYNDSKAYKDWYTMGPLWGHSVRCLKD